MTNHGEGEPSQAELPGMPDRQQKRSGIRGRWGARTIPTIQDHQRHRVHPENITRMRRIKDMAMQGIPKAEIDRRIAEELAAEAEIEHELTPELPGMDESDG
ncbi:MAG: hypothetical protein A2900_04540 [Candidatus Chisholmbacteria bacterium RIFCSPLOWO2_01_FULL_50_28]|uniref:Uncharacterized protein n=1 Tax=Candidatus Chisholmbacteria bacterium RIFCSPHIGHO2_01_FULL_52_32 TaxID=1797591 RepID=A0A1G1VSD7_9BACT|nr:MAG: hypothetical protein A2786_02205 [Candidatus Chisholmbacteria bacterium RIFCSPHIGHO2_01_FULL_52_32]OGY20319.1 MAG: hypothetical protein A2900_04540 [Candidatus Chisholmbacteria bacterium RIFCSPLOWO2_01_FULL_50_28]